ncbi:MAG: hypothetical protein ABIB79_04495, partial [archaeon]
MVGFSADDWEELNKNYGNPSGKFPDYMKPVDLTDVQETQEENALVEVYEGRIENWRERFPEERIEHYRDGASGGIFKAWDTEKKGFVGLKELKGSKEGVDLEFLQTGKDQIRNIKDMIGALGKSTHPGLMQIYGYYELERRGLKYPQLVFELIDQPSLLDKINGSASEEEVRRFLLAGGSTLYNLHTSNGQPIFHRDVKPANFMAMSEDSRWPYILVDFGTVGTGVRGTIDGGTHTGTLNYVSHKQLAFGKVNKWGENFSLIRSGIHYALGSRFGDIDLDGFDIRSLDLNYSDKLLDVFSSATTQEESRGYSDFKKLMHDLGYERAEIPKTRAELETILSGNSLPVKIKTQENLPAERGFDSDLPEIVFREADNHYYIVGSGIGFKRGEDVYETYRNLEQVLEDDRAEALELGPGVPNYAPIKLAYLKHIAKNHPAIADALCGCSSLENTARGIRKMEDKKERNIAADRFAEVIKGANEFSLETTDYKPNTNGEQYVFYGHTPFRYPLRKAIFKKAKELDGYIAEVRRGNGLEGKVGNVELSGRQTFITFLTNLNPPTALPFVPLYLGAQKLSKKILTNRA